PRAVVLVFPERAAGMDKKNLKLPVSSPEHKQTRAQLLHVLVSGGLSFGEQSSVAGGASAEAEQANARPERVRQAGHNRHLAALFEGSEKLQRLQGAAGDYDRVRFWGRLPHA